MQAVHKHVNPTEPETVWPVMLTPDYLPTNQSEEHHELVTHPAALPLPVFKNISLKATREFRSFEHYLSGLLV